VSTKRDSQNIIDEASVAQADQSERDLAGEIVGLYPRVHAGRVFRQQLHADLVETMRRRSRLRVSEPVEHRRWALIAGAAVGSLVPLVGVAAYLVCSRSTSKAQHAATQ
jgi:hypothetical protein